MQTDIQTTTEPMGSSIAILQRTSPAVRPALTRLADVLYRAFEIIFAATVLLLTIPVMALIALIIKRGTPGPMLFFQYRLGKNAKPFRFVKFRTMHADARHRFPDLYQYAYSDKEIETLVFKIKNDPRLTPQGRWLRKTSLDELPNFWNVLTGDMALVGPRPEIPEMLPYYTGNMRDKFSVRPGITGLAQICGRGNLSFRETAELDVLYVHRRSAWGDIKILFESCWAVFKATGAF